MVDRKMNNDAPSSLPVTPVSNVDTTVGTPLNVDMNFISLAGVGVLVATACGIFMLSCLRAFGFINVARWIAWLSMIFIVVRGSTEAYKLWSVVWFKPVNGSKLAITLLVLMPSWIAYIHFSRFYETMNAATTASASMEESQGAIDSLGTTVEGNVHANR